jgi:hypothetical protein
MMSTRPPVRDSDCDLLVTLCCCVMAAAALAAETLRLMAMRDSKCDLLVMLRPCVAIHSLIHSLTHCWSLQAPWRSIQSWAGSARQRL